MDESNLDKLYKMLNEQLNLLNDNYALEDEKYHVILKDDINRLNQIVLKENAFYMKLRGEEIKREKCIKDLGYEGLTLKEMIGKLKIEDKIRFEELDYKLSKILLEFKRVNDDCQELAKIRLKRAQNMVSSLQNSSENHMYDKSERDTSSRDSIFSTKI